jgi:hypothetical protein
MKVHAFAVGLAAVVVSASSHACKCVGPPSYDAVFEGRVVRTLADRAQPDQFTEVHLSVTRRSIGRIGRTATVYTPLPVLMCGVSFEVGRSYVVRASRVHGRLETLECYGTKKK